MGAAYWLKNRMRRFQRFAQHRIEWLQFTYMEKATIISVLDRLWRELLPFATAHKPGAEIWDGSQFARIAEAREPDPIALAWSSQISTISSMLLNQDGPVSEKQVAYLRKQFFGGMLSFSDIYFDEVKLGPHARGLNQRLDALRAELAQTMRD